MTTHIEGLRDTLNGLQRRQTRRVYVQYFGYALIGLSGVFAAALGLLVAFALPPLFGAALLVAAGLAAVGIVLSALRRARSGRADQRALALYVEECFPDLEQRLLTSLEFSPQAEGSPRSGVSAAFVQQLWRDAEQHVELQRREVERAGSAREPFIAFVSGAAALAVVVLALQESSELRAAAQRLFQPYATVPSIAEVQPAMPVVFVVEPGDVELQRGSALTVVVRVENAQPSALTLRLQDDRLNWRDYPMTLDASDESGSSFSYYLPAVMKESVYAVSLAATAQTSREHRITLFDLPQVEKIAVALDFPDYTGEEDSLEPDGGDIVAPEGTEVGLTIEFNKPLASARVEFESASSGGEEAAAEADGYTSTNLDVKGLTASAAFTVKGDGIYRILATDLDGLQSAAPLDYYIRSIPDQPPVLTLRRPGADQEVMPLEEVMLEVDASDDYGLSEFVLNYAVVGTDDSEVDFLKAQAAGGLTSTRSASGSTLLYLEDLAVEPGDFISYYLTLADNNALKGPSEVVSDIYFLEVIPTDQEFRRAQQQQGGGGGGQGGGESSALVTVQKDIIAATWKLRNRLRSASEDDIEGDAEIIAESQREATGRARMSIDRLAERLSFSDDSYDLAVENLSLAIEQMNLAAADLDELQVTTALKPEQLALQYILKAEANINRTDISMQQGGGGGGGGGAQQEREDLRELFEMEMGQLENRYETPGGASQPGGSNAEEVNKLEELARRQEALTRAQRNLARREQELEEEQRRRELERLQRQQEQLTADLEQLSRQMAGGQQRQSSPSQAQGGSQQSSSQGAQQSGQQQGPQTAMERAIEQMQQAANSDSAAIAAAQGQKALESLRDQQRELTAEGESSVAQIARRLGERGQALQRQQQALEAGLQAVTESQGLGQTRREARRDEALDALLDAQRQQQRDIEEIEDMLRAVVTRGDAEDRRLLTQAQAATRELSPIRDDMATSNRVLRNGMVNLAIDMEQELGDQIETLAQSLARLDPSLVQEASSGVQQAASDAQQLREQIESLEEQVARFDADAAQAGTLAQMREQLEASQALAEGLSEQLAQQRGSQQSGQRGGLQRGQAGTGLEGSEQSEEGPDGTVAGQRGQANPVGTARSIRQQLTRQDIEDFLAQPELLQALLQPIIELEGALRAQAERESAATQLYSADEEQIPEAYRELVEEYYRTLSEGDSGGAD
jgi:hypothetical protein